MNAPFEQEIEFLYTYAKATLEQTGKMLPMAVLIGPASRKVVALAWKDDDDKQKMVLTVLAMISRERIHTWLFASEMWIAGPVKEGDIRPARTYPDREEGILVSGRERGRGMTITVKFRRGKEGFHFHGEHRSATADDYKDILWGHDGQMWDSLLAAREA